MGRIEETLRSLGAVRRKALTLFFTAGYPRRNSTPGLVGGLADAGADIIEIGMPFSDPMADGAVIQKSSQVALKNGMTLPLILDDVRTIRKRSAVPIVLMGYLNPILRYGAERFFRDAAESGVDGMILPELPLEENGRYGAMMAAASLSNILLVTPTTRDARVREIDERCRGFLYCVSHTGVTGSEGAGRSIEYIRRIQTMTHNPLLVGFGIATPDDARAYAGASDGVIVGSALLKRIGEGERMKGIGKWVRRMKEAMSETDREIPNPKFPIPNNIQ